MNQFNATAKNQIVIDTTNVCLNTIVGLFPVGSLCRNITMEPGDYFPENMAGINGDRKSVV